ncbi:S-layer homology domain-containing protein [Agathobaculum sp. Marseille-P7918]
MQEGLLTGTTSTTLEPQEQATRAQVAAILQRFIQSMA